MHHEIEILACDPLLCTMNHSMFIVLNQNEEFISILRDICKSTIFSLSTMCCFIFQPFKAGADPGFMERGFVCIKVLGFALLILSHFS